jgi:hypothetical protein
VDRFLGAVTRIIPRLWSGIVSIEVAALPACMCWLISPYIYEMLSPVSGIFVDPAGHGARTLAEVGRVGYSTKPHILFLSLSRYFRTAGLEAGCAAHDEKVYVL